MRRNRPASEQVMLGFKRGTIPGQEVRRHHLLVARRACRLIDQQVDTPRPRSTTATDARPHPAPPANPLVDRITATPGEQARVGRRAGTWLGHAARLSRALARHPKRRRLHRHPQFGGAVSDLQLRLEVAIHRRHVVHMCSSLRGCAAMSGGPDAASALIAAVARPGVRPDGPAARSRPNTIAATVCAASALERVDPDLRGPIGVAAWKCGGP
jgi:hypothetical protein